MRYFLNSDPYFYYEPPNNWNLFCQQLNSSWHRPAQEFKHSINYWRDLEGAKMEITLKKDLHIKYWPTTRLRPKASLPIYYGTGIERPNYNYENTKTAKILKKLEDLKVEKAKKLQGKKAKHSDKKTARKLKKLEDSKNEKANNFATAKKLKRK